MIIFIILFMLAISLAAIIIRAYNNSRFSRLLIKEVLNENIGVDMRILKRKLRRKSEANDLTDKWLEHEVFYKITKIEKGPFFDFIIDLHKKYKTPLTSLYSFESPLRLPFRHYPFSEKVDSVFTIPLLFKQSRCPILIPEQWFKVFDDSDIKWFICHEMGYLSFKHFLLRIGCFFNINSYFTKDETNADIFAANILGFEQSISTMYKLKDLCGDSRITMRIARLRLHHKKSVSL